MSDGNSDDGQDAAKMLDCAPSRGESNTVLITLFIVPLAPKKFDTITPGWTEITSGMPSALILLRHDRRWRPGPGRGQDARTTQANNKEVPRERHRDKRKPDGFRLFVGVVEAGRDGGARTGLSTCHVFRSSTLTPTGGLAPVNAVPSPTFANILPISLQSRS